MDIPVVPTVLIAVLLVGSLIQLIWNRDDWPLSNYSMYSHLVSDHARNPFVPLGKGHAGEAGFFVLSIKLADGSSIPLTTSYAHPLLMPYERLRVLRHLITMYKRGADLAGPLQRLARWVHRRNAETGQNLPITALSLELYIWKKVPERPEKSHAPDEIVALGQAELPR